MKLHVHIIYDNTLIEKVIEPIGVKFDNNRSWASHVDYLAKNVS